MLGTSTWLAVGSLTATVGVAALAQRNATRLEHLRAELTRQMESQKTNWTLAARLSELRFSRLHEKQFDALHKSFILLTGVHLELIDIFKRARFQNERSDAEKVQAAGGAAQKLQDFLNTDGVLLPPGLSEKIEAVNKEFLSAWIGLSFRDVDSKIFFDTGEAYFTKAPPLLAAIREEVQKSLGVIERQQPTDKGLN